MGLDCMGNSDKLKEMNGKEPIKDNVNSTCGSCKGKCCSNCAYSVGYFDRHNCSSDIKLALGGLRESLHDGSSTERHLETLRKHWGDSVQWSVINGFLTTTGCSIPREHRSQICREYICAFLKGQDSGNTFKDRVKDWHKERVLRGLT